MKSFNRFKIPLLYISCMIMLMACNTNNQVVEPNLKQKEQLVMRSPVIKKEPKIFRKEIKYGIDTLETRDEIDSLLQAYPEEQLQTLLAINRIEKANLRPNRPIVIPDCLAEDLLAYSPFPETVQSLKCIPKTVLINQRVQAFGLYENGDLIKWGPVSTGKKSTATPNGLNYGNYKAKRKISTVDPSWVLPYYFNFMNMEGIGVHQYSLPGYPASHGCVRLYMDDARYIFDWAQMWELNNSRVKKNGTPFMVFGEYDHKGSKPWMSLSQNMRANDLNQTELDIINEYVEEYQKDPRNFHNITPQEEEVELAQA